MRPFAIAVLVLSCCASKVNADCECAKTDFATIANEAERILHGSVTSAELKGDRVHFVIDVLDTIRGPAVEQYSLTTDAPTICGIPIFVRARLVFYIKNDSPNVDGCSGSTGGMITISDTSQAPTDIIKALRLANYRGGDPQAIIPILWRGFSPRGMHAAWITEVLTLVSKLKPHGTEFERTERGLLYRDIEFRIEGDDVVEIRPALR